MADEAIQPEANEPAVQVPKGNKPTMAVKVYAPFKVYFEGDAYSVSAVNDVGPFDILPRHHNFLCMLVPCTLSIETPKGQQTVKIHRALMHVKADRVVVFVDV
jgi:F0F1-type ATP synthase epsilon subunit